MSYALIRPDVGVLMQKLNITDLESVDLDSLIAGGM